MFDTNCTGQRWQDDFFKCGRCPGCKAELEIKVAKAKVEAGIPQDLPRRALFTVVVGPFKIEL
jgi:uncharacterized protein with PIN domain